MRLSERRNYCLSFLSFEKKNMEFWTEMKSFSDIMRKRLSQQFRGKNMIGSIILNELNAFYHIEKDENLLREREVLEGYFKNDKFFIKTQDLALRIQIFKDKRNLLEVINAKLESLGYSLKIDDLYFK